MEGTDYHIEELLANTPDLRVATNLERCKKINKSAYEKAKLIVDCLREIKFRFAKANSPWKKALISKLDLGVSESTIKDWFLGRASIPWVSLEKISELGKDNQRKLILDNCDYFCTKTSSIAYFPKEISKELAWLIAAILCDGHMRYKYDSVAFEVSDVDLANKFCAMFSSVFESKLRKPRVVDRVGYNRTYAVGLSNVPALLFLNSICEVPVGYKCNKIIVPIVIKFANTEIKKAFLMGVFETDGGKRGAGLGLTSLSEQFVCDVSYLLEEFGIKSHKESWINKKYQKKCFGLRFKIDAYSKFLMRQGQSFASKDH